MDAMEPLDALRKAGDIAAEVRDTVLKEIEPGVKVLDICDRAEEMIKDLGGGTAFPTNGWAS